MNKYNKDSATRFVLVTLSALIQLTLTVVAVELYALETIKVRGTLLDQKCETQFSLYADHGNFEYLLKLDENYQRVRVPKSMCEDFREGEFISFRKGRITGVILTATATSHEWHIFSVTHLVLFFILFAIYAPPIQRSPICAGAIVIVFYFSYRWVVATF